MIAILLVDLLFMGAAVYLFLTGRTVAGIALVAMGAVASGVLVLRWLADQKEQRARSERAAESAGSKRPL